MIYALFLQFLTRGRRCLCHPHHHRHDHFGHHDWKYSGICDPIMRLVWRDAKLEFQFVFSTISQKQKQNNQNLLKILKKKTGRNFKQKRCQQDNQWCSLSRYHLESLHIGRGCTTITHSINTALLDSGFFCLSWDRTFIASGTIWLEYIWL